MRIEQESCEETTEADGSYLLYAMTDGNQAESLANYLCRHGREASASGNEVTCWVSDEVDAARDAAEVFQLKAFWRLWWRYHESELYGLPCYHKPACSDHSL